jgi:hypothetical protein
MAALVETEQQRAALVTSASELSNRTGGVLRALASGALVRVDDNRVGAAAALLVPPSLIPLVLSHLGISADSLPEPGTVRDAL